MKEITFGEWDRTTPLDVRAHNDGVHGKNEVIRDVQLYYCLLRDKYLRYATFYGGAIRHCRFEYAYLREATFERIDLTGTTFVNCNLEKTTFTACTLWYTTFVSCELNYESLLQSLPLEPNLKQRLLRNLRVNAFMQGDREWEDRLRRLELDAEREEYRNGMRAASAYYTRKYAGIRRFEVSGKYVLRSAGRLIWGDGLRLGNLFASALFIIGAFAIAAKSVPASYVILSTVEQPIDVRTLSWPEALYYSIISFSTGGFGDIIPGNVWARTLTATEGVLGVLFLGFLAAALFRRFAK